MTRRIGNTRFPRCGLQAIVWVLFLVGTAGSGPAQNAAPERTFRDSKAAVEKTLKGLQSSIAGRLPLLDGFAVPAERPLDRFQRPYYQCTVVVNSTPSGGTVVRVNAKITAWYSDPVPSRSGYQTVLSNGRLESDLLDRLGEALGAKPSTPPNSPATAAVSRPAIQSDPAAPTISAPMPRIPDSTVFGRALSRNPVKQDPPLSLNAQTAAAEKHERELAAEAKNLEDILHNQSHPNNLAAVRRTGTPVLERPSVEAKALFMATAGDEFEILDVNPDWVHIRISGISRGWIRRSSLEMPEDLQASAHGSESGDHTEQFRVSSQQFAPFPGDWEPLRGKTVKLITVQRTLENVPNSSPQAKKDFTQALFAKEYPEVSASSQGIVLIFDAEDGGMVAATLPALQQWKAGQLSDDAFWHKCFFDPPELFSSPPPSASE